MARYPDPPSGKLSGPDAKIVRTLDGHRIENSYTDDDYAEDLRDQDWRRNERDFDEADLGGEYGL